MPAFLTPQDSVFMVLRTLLHPAPITHVSGNISSRGPQPLQRSSPPARLRKTRRSDGDLSRTPEAAARTRRHE